MYLDLLTQVPLLDHQVWASQDTWNTALDLAAKKKSKGKGGGFWIFAAVCCIGIIVLILGIVYLMRKKKSQ
ncbi:hypothetical protein JK358_02620 [Nocardia sp. 2]|uniref:Uncharacterized protein n=1 Tax=Nocardia acididurans TaxID=2802282 RepID=A0ABS1LY15_9NOCA|nr:hypothetical protein [Nocardia acididurans]MBL1073282.1 hypothetical protein [Nocardia acididurans]